MEQNKLIWELAFLRWKSSVYKESGKLAKQKTECTKTLVSGPFTFGKLSARNICVGWGSRGRCKQFSGSWENQLSAFYGTFSRIWKSFLESEEATKLLELSWRRCHWRPWRWGCNLRLWCNLGSSQEYDESKRRRSRKRRKRNWTRRPFSTSFTLSDVLALAWP